QGRAGLDGGVDGVALSGLVPLAVDLPLVDGGAGAADAGHGAGGHVHGHQLVRVAVVVAADDGVVALLQAVGDDQVLQRLGQVGGDIAGGSALDGHGQGGVVHEGDLSHVHAGHQHQVELAIAVVVDELDRVG